MKRYLELNNELMRKKDGFFQLEKDLEAVESFAEDVNSKMKKFDNHILRLKWLIENDFYIDFFKLYKEDEVSKLIELIYSYQFKFKSYMAISKFYQSYALKTNDKKEYLETYEDRIICVALFLGQGNIEKAIEIGVSMIEQRYQPATPTFLNAGRSRAGKMISCFKGDTPVLMSNGKYKNICDITKDDEVITHDGTTKKVMGVSVKPYNGKHCEVNLAGTFETLGATEEHPILAIKKSDILCIRDKSRYCSDNRPRSKCLAKKNLHKSDCYNLTEGVSGITKWIPIKNLEEGDFVAISYDNEFNNVGRLDMMDYLDDGFILNDSGDEIIKHNVNFYRERTSSQIEYDKKINPVKRFISLDKEFGLLIGYYLAEGYINKRNSKPACVVFTINSKDTHIINEIKYLSKKIFNIEATENKNRDNSVRVTISNVAVAQFILNLIGSMFDLKQLPTELMKANLEFQRGVIIGAFRGDGCTFNNGMVLSLTNKHLIKDISNLLYRQGLMANIREYVSQSNKLAYEVRIINYNKEHRLLIEEINKDIHKFTSKKNVVQSVFLNRDGYLFRKVNKVEVEVIDEPVFNLEVEENHTYLVNNYVVHNCFLLSMDDSLNSINYVLNTCAQLSKVGGGVAVDVTRLRGRNETIKGIENASSGVIPVLKLLEDTFAYVNQLGQRNGAGVAYLNIFHWDIEEFLDTKKINASEKSRLQTLSIGTIIPNKFMELAEKGNEYYVFAPHTVYQATGKYLDEIDLNEEYDNLVNNPKIKKRLLNPRKILVNISKMQFESGYPYIMFSDNANKDHALKELGRIKMSNLCSEIFQLQETSIINDYGVEDIIKRDVCCNLGSLNIANVMDYKAIKESVYSAMDALTVVSNESYLENAPGVNKANKELHAVGLGAMNLHGYLTKSYIPYESEEAKEFVSQFFMMVNYYSLKRSVEIAKEKNETFLGFEKSEYANGQYFEKYLQNDYTAKSPKVVKLFEGMEVPTKEDWIALKEDVAKYGLYHAYRLAIAPTQSIGYVQNATPSVTPVVDLIERRTYGDSTTYYPMPYLSPYNVLLYKSAFNMDMFKMIDLIAVMQEHIDQGISTTLYVSSDTTTKELTRYYIYAYKKGLKALYYTRTKNLAFEECLVCSV